MSAPIACMLCSIDPATANMLLPMAQATVIAAPILLRDHVKRGARAVAGRLRDTPLAEAEAVDDPVRDGLEDTEPA